MAEDQRAVHDKETPWMHIYGQEQQHDDVLIAGNRKALQSLLQAVSRALTKAPGEQYEPIVCFAADGEGYRVTVVCDAAEIVGQMRLPYSDQYFHQDRAALAKARGEA